MTFRLSIAFTAGLVACAQQTNSDSIPTAALFGRVVSAQSHQPIRRAAIKIYRGNDQWDQFSDADGRFQFPPIKRAEYGFVAHRDGFTDRTYKVELSDFDNPKELLVELFPQSVITGRVIDAVGLPLEGARIEALGAGAGGDAAVVASAETNDLGEYRLSGLRPGSYRIRAAYRGGRESEFDPTPLTIASQYYGSPEKATEFAVKAGSVSNGIDFTLNPAKPAVIRGTVVTSIGQPVEHATLWIMGRSGEGGHNGQAENGKFEVNDLGPGSYTISAEISNGPSPSFGVVTVQIAGSDVNGVEIVMHASPRIHGQIQSENGGAIPKLDAVYFRRSDRVELPPMKIARPDSSGAFELVLNPGDYTLTFAGLPAGVAVKRATLDEKLVANWKISIESSAENRQLLIVLGNKPQ